MGSSTSTRNIVPSTSTIEHYIVFWYIGTLANPDFENLT
jgi:hypothetical protein